MRHPLVHLELRTADLARACLFYRRLFGWRAEAVHAGPRSYVSLALGDGLGGGLAEQDGPATWLPYVEVRDVDALAARAISLGAEPLVERREGPAGWWCVLTTPEGGPVALWQAKT